MTAGDTRTAAEAPAAVEAAPSRAAPAPHGASVPPAAERAGTWLVNAPDRLLLLFLWSALVVAVTVTLGIFYRPLVIVGVLAVVVVTWRLKPEPVPANAQSILGSVGALSVALVWVLVNRRYAAQLLSIAVDPGVYTVRAFWLVHHHSPNIGVSSALRAARDVPIGTIQAGGFPFLHGMIRPQGNTLVPGLVAFAGWFGGSGAVLQGNLVIGGLALLAVYSFARRLMGPLWALVPMIGLSLCTPMIYFSRAPYTEPTAMLVTFGGLTMLWSGWRSRSTVQFLLAGLFIGASQIARIDGLVAVIGASGGIALIAVFATNADMRRRSRGYLLSFAVGAVVVVLLGALDLTVNSPAYFSELKSRLKPLTALLLLAVVGGIALSALPPVHRIARWLRVNGPRLGRVVVVVGALAFLVMLSRPLWWHPHFNKSPVVQQVLARDQVRAGARPDGARSYDENTINWLSWYLGWPLVLLAGAGLIGLAWYAFRRRDPRLFPFLGIVGMVSVLYLNVVSITPVQIWAMRRLLPVVIPALFIAAAWACVRVARLHSGAKWLAAAMAVGIVASPALQWNHLIKVGEQAGEFNEVTSACRVIHGDKVILTGNIPASGYYLPSLVAVCGKATIYVPKPNEAFLAKIRDNWGGDEVTVVTFTAASVPWTTPPTVPVHAGVYPSWPRTLFGKPRVADEEPRTLWAGRLQADGRVVPLSG